MAFIGTLGRKKYIKFWTNALSVLLVGIIIYALFNEKITPYDDTNDIQFVRINEIIPPPKVDEKIIQQVKINQAIKAQEQKAEQIKQAINQPANTKTTHPAHNINIEDNTLNARAVHILPSTIDTTTNNKAAGNNGNSDSLPRLAGRSQNTVYNIDCEKIDIKDRPKDCPKSDLAKKLVKMEQSKVKLDKVTGFTAAEMNSKRYAGWREPCETENGGKYQVCIQTGKKPTRVKTPYELCMEKGLGGCTRPKRPDGSDDQALNYGN